MNETPQKTSTPRSVPLAFPRWVNVPTEPCAWIPLGLSQEDFDLLVATINMWQERITATLVGRDSALCGDRLPQHSKQLVLGALDSLGVALTNHGHEWSAGERAIYEEACNLMGAKSEGDSSVQGGNETI
jgi:hypothetical protein